MTERLVKCYGTCDLKHYKSEMKQIGGKNFCEKCYMFSVKERNDREDLYHYIQETFNLTFPTGLMLRQIKTFKEERGYSYKNIRFTLVYVLSVRRIYKAEIKFGIAFVPHFYDEMITYYKELAKKRADTVVKEQVVQVVKMEKPKENTVYVEKKIINMDDLLDGGN